MAILFSFIFFSHNIKFSKMRENSIFIKFYLSILMSINFIIINHISLFINLVNFLYFVLLKLDFSNIVVIIVERICRDF